MQLLLERLALAGSMLAALAPPLPAATGPFDGREFKGRIAWSADGNFNDEDDWGASPAALAIFARSGVAGKLVHFDYNCILYDNDPAWAEIHADILRRAAERFGYRQEIFHDCQAHLEAAVDSIAAAIDASSADDPLWFVLAGPMEVPLKGMQKADPAKLKHVYCISHSRWNDGFDQKDGGRFRSNKRAVIPLGVHWVQIADQNAFLSTSRYGAPAKEADWEPWLWMRDSADADVRFLWECLRAVTRADCSDAGMARFLVTGDEENTIAKLRDLVEGGKIATPIAERSRIRIEAENFREFDGVELEYRNDRNVSHRIDVKLSGGRDTGRLRTTFEQPYTAAEARYEVEIRCFDAAGARSGYALSVAGARVGEIFSDPAEAGEWVSHTFPGVTVRTGDSIAVEMRSGEGERGRIDYVEFLLIEDRAHASVTAPAGPPPADGVPLRGIWTSAIELQKAPTSGPVWDSVLLAARADTSAPDIADQDDRTNTRVLAAAIAHARTGLPEFRKKCVAAIERLVDRGHPGGRTLAWAREAGAYALAADLIEYRTPEFESWLRNIADQWEGDDDRTVREMFYQRPNNWGHHAFGTLCAIDAYLGDIDSLRRVRQHWVDGLDGVAQGYDFGRDLSWHLDEARPRVINPKGAVRNGIDIDGIIPDDMRRGGSLRARPEYTGYAWETQQGLVMAARILERAGMPIWEAGDRALYRAAYALQVRLGSGNAKWKAKGDDLWMLPFYDRAYGG